MESNFFLRLLRLFALVCIQVMICNNIHLFGCVSPIIISYMLVCMNQSTSRTALLLWGFAIGLIHDMFANTAGIAAASCTLAAMVQPKILSMFLPRDAANDFTPSFRSLGLFAYMTYTLLLTFIVNAAYIMLSMFTLSNWQTTLCSIGGSVVLSTAVIMFIDSIVHGNRGSR